MYEPNQPSNCDFSDCCKFIVDLRASAPNPFEHLSEDEFKIVLSDIVVASRTIRQNPDLLDSLEHSEITELVRAIYALDTLAKETMRQ